MEYIDLRNRPELIDRASSWFSSKWGIPKEAYYVCMNNYLNKNNEYAWLLCLDKENIIGGLGVIDNDFHNRPDLTPNVCALFVEENYRGIGIAGKLLEMIVKLEKDRGITPIYLLTDHTNFYERYGWVFHSFVQGNDEDHLSRMYIHH